MVALIFCGDLCYCPYRNRYIERLEHHQIDYKVYFWNRGNYEINTDNKYAFFDSASQLNKSKILKIFDFISFRKWVARQIKSDRPDKVVFLSTLSGVFLYDIIKRRNIEYLFDIRDYSYEHIAPFYAIEKQLIKKSAYTVISSKGFRKFLPQHNYIIAHNFNRSEIAQRYKFEQHGNPIRIVWNGVVRYFEFQKKYIDALKNDERFQMIYHGSGPEFEKFSEYCEQQGVNNVIFTGYYDNKQKKNLLKDADILNNCYGIEGKEKKVKYAVSNRFYDGIIYHIPQIVEPDGFKPRWVKRVNIGENFMVDEKFADRLYNYYMGISEEDFNKACDAVLREVICEDDEYIEAIDNFIKK